MISLCISFYLVLFPLTYMIHVNSFCRPVKGGVDAKELFHLYILIWIEDKRLTLLESCKLDKVCITPKYLS